MDENLSRGYCQLRRPPIRTAQPASSGSGSGSGSGSMGQGRTSSTVSSAIPTASRGGAVDRCSCVYLALILCGAGFLLPYNSFITAVDYYQARYPNSTIIFDMSLTYICVAFTAVLINNLLVETFSLNVRISFGYVIAFFTLLLVALCDVAYDVFPPSQSYFVTLVAVAVVAFGCTVQQSSFYGYTSMLPPRYTQAVMTGESAAGVIVSINRILTKSFLDDVHTNTIIFFSISIATVAMCCLVFHITRHSMFVRYHVSACKNAEIGEDQRAITHSNQCNPEEVEILDGTVSRDHYGVLVLQSPTSPGVETPAIPAAIASAPAQNALSDQRTRATETQLKMTGHAYRRHISCWDNVKNGVRRRMHVSRGVWPYMLSIGLAYFVTLCLFPGIESEVVSCRLHSWMPVLLISAFNFSDFFGKILASVPYDWPRGRLALCTSLRILLVPLLMMCAAPRSSPLLQAEVWPLLFSTLLGLTNGYFGSVPMILAPSRVPDEHKELTGNIMTLSYSLGLTLGSAVAYLLNVWLGPHLSQDPCQANETNHTMHTNISTIQIFPQLPPTDLLPG